MWGAACDYRVKNTVIPANASQCGRGLLRAADVKSTLPRRSPSLVVFVTCFQLMSNGEYQNDIFAW